MNIDNDLPKNGMDLDDDVLYNFMGVTSQQMRDDGVTPWKGPREKHPLFFQVLINDLSKSKGTFANVIAYTSIKKFTLFEIIYIYL